MHDEQFKQVEVRDTNYTTLHDLGPATTQTVKSRIVYLGHGGNLGVSEERQFEVSTSEFQNFTTSTI